MYNKKILILLMLSLFSISFLFAQKQTKEQKQLYKKAFELFDSENFIDALPLFLKYDSIYGDNDYVNYYIGACYLNTSYQKTKAIPYLKKALRLEKKLIPAAVYKDIGFLYLYQYKYDSALIYFKNYIKLSDKYDEDRSYINKVIEDCKLANTITPKDENVRVTPLDSIINDENNNVFPVISTDEELLYFTRSERIKRNGIIVDGKSKIMFANKKGFSWGIPKKLKISYPKEAKKISLVGASPEGYQLFFRIDIDSVNSDLFVCKLKEDSCVELKALNKKINSKFKESMCSITADGKDFYFTSNRPGGFGGLDIYKITRNDYNSWSEPINLGLEINTEFDEDGPFIHPDKKTLYFSSKGLLSMGGYDFYTTHFSEENNSWSLPENLGPPINSSYDDLGIYLSTDGSVAYYSSRSKSNDLKYRIFKAKFSKSIPLTLVKGIILGNDDKPLKAKIRVIDHDTKKRIKYVYNPNPTTGKYLMIFPPGKNYDMIIDADGYLPHIVNIHIPEQTYFYSLYQEVHLEKIKFNETENIGERISVTNTFYDIYNTQDDKNDITKNDKLKPKPKQVYDNLLNLINELIEKTDSLGVEKLDSVTYYAEDETPVQNKKQKQYDDLINLIDQAIETTDSISLNKLDEKTAYNQNTTKTYFYNSGTKKYNLVPYIIGNDTIMALPPLSTSATKEQLAEDVKPQRNSEVKKQLDLHKTPINNREYILTTSVYFKSNKSDLSRKGYNKVKNIATLLLNNPDLGVEINGYTDAKGTEKHNKILSDLRARAVLQVLVENDIMPQRAVLKGYGETKALKNDNPEDRRADINIFQIKDISDVQIANKSEEINDVFPINEKLINLSNVEYKIQVAACMHPKTKKLKYKGLDVTWYKYGKCKNYVYGSYKTKDEAINGLVYVIKKGFKGAFIVKFVDNKRVSE